MVHEGLLAQDCDPRFEVWRLDVPGVPVRGYDDLLVLLIERVEGVEEGLLGLDLVLEELDVVDQENVVLAVALLELEGRIVPHRVYEVVGELLAGNVPDPHAGVLVLHVVPHGPQEVGLAEAHAAVDKERVVDQTRGLGDGERRRVGEPVASPDNERIERILGPERPRRSRVQDGLGALRGGPVTGMVAWPPHADHQGGFPVHHVDKRLLQKWPEAALYVLFGEHVGDRDLQLILLQGYGTNSFEPHPERRDVYVIGGPIQDLGPDLLGLTYHATSPRN